MATKLSAPFTAYGRNTGNQTLFPLPFVTKRAPTIYDQGEVGQLWVDSSADTAYVLTSAVQGVNTWSVAPTGGVAAASFTVNPGNFTVTAGNALISAGNLTVSAGITNVKVLAATNTTIVGTLGVTGTTTIAGATNINTTNALTTAIGRGGTGLLNLGNLTADTTVWGKNVTLELGDAAGADAFKVLDNTTALVANIDSTGNLATALDITSIAGDITATAGDVIIGTATKGLTLPGPTRIITGAGDPAAPLAVNIGDIYIRTDAVSAVTRIFIATAAGTWTTITCAA